MDEPRRRRLLQLPSRTELEFFDWPLEKVTYCTLWMLFPICFFWLLIDVWETDRPTDEPQGKRHEQRWNWYRVTFVLTWLIVLIVFWIVSPDIQPWRAIVGGLAGLRLLEIVVSGIGTILNQRQQVGARNKVTILVYAAQVALIFAILYHSFAASGFGLLSHHPTTAADFLYMSFSAMVSLGHHEFVPKTDVAKFLEVATTGANIFLFGVLLTLVTRAPEKPGLG